MISSFTEAVFDKTSAIPTIKNVVLLGAESKNSREYTGDAMIGAVSLYEGVKAFINHPSLEEEKLGRRDIRNLAGKYVNVKMLEGKIRGDFVGLPNNANTLLYMNIAENMPDLAGNSHNAVGKWKSVNGKQIVEQILKVNSVDLVAEPATTKGMFESHKENNMDYAQLTIDLFKANRPDLFASIVAESVKTKDDEINKLTESLAASKKSLDEITVKEAIATKKATVEKLLTESKLPTEAKTELFRETLISVVATADKTLESQVKALIEDRLVAIGTKKVVKNMGGGADNLGDVQESALFSTLKG